jgi:PAS domain S-box-containing protein
MIEKPAYEELEQRIKKLEEDAVERKRAEEEIQESEEKYRNLVERANDGVVIVQDGKVKFSNARLAEMLGYTVERIVNTSFLDYVFPEERSRIADIYKRRFQGEDAPDIYEMAALHKDGGRIDIEINSGQITHDGKPATLSLIRDITDRKQAEEGLRESEEQLRSLLQSIQAAVVVHGPNTEILACNRASQELLGITEDQMLGKQSIDPSWRFFNEDGSDMPSELYPVNRVMASKSILVDLIMGIYRPMTNDVVRVLVNAVPETDYDGNISQVIVTFMDVTERKRLESQLQQSQKMEAISTLAGGVAHQFRNALSPIMAGLDMIEVDLPEGHDISQYVEPMRSSARRMSGLTNQLLAYARGGQYQAKPLSMSTFIRDTLPILKHTLKASVHVEMDLLDENVCVEADMTQMQMVLSAIMSNASDAIEERGHVHISCGRTVVADQSADDHPGMGPGPYAYLKIEDDGKGMDRETAAQVFEPFYTTKFQGRGLGMAAAYGIVKNHNGWIFLDSVPGKGTTVHVHLPTVDADH